MSCQFGDMPPPRISRASSPSAVFQQLARSRGIGIAALLVHHLMAWRGSTRITSEDIAPAFIFVAVLTMVSLLFFIPVAKNAGTELSGRATTPDPD